MFDGFREAAEPDFRLAARHDLIQPANRGVPHDAWPLPIPAHVNRATTIGVQHLAYCDVRGDFIISPTTLPALAP